MAFVSSPRDQLPHWPRPSISSKGWILKKVVSRCSSYPGIALVFWTPFLSPFRRQRKFENLPKSTILLSSRQCLVSNGLIDVFILVVSEEFGKRWGSYLGCLHWILRPSPPNSLIIRKEHKPFNVEQTSSIWGWQSLNRPRLWCCA